MPFGLNFERISAIIERDMRKFFRSPALMVSSMVFPLMQLIVLGYAFGGKIKGITIALVDEDRSSQSRIVRERFNAIAAGPGRRWEGNRIRRCGTSAGRRQGN